MSDTQLSLDGLTLDELQGMRAALRRSIATGSLATQFPDGSRVQYRTLTEMERIAALIDGWIVTLQPPVVEVPLLNRPVRTAIIRPRNGYR